MKSFSLILFTFIVLTFSFNITETPTQKELLEKIFLQERVESMIEIIDKIKPILDQTRSELSSYLEYIKKSEFHLNETATIDEKIKVNRLILQKFEEIEIKRMVVRNKEKELNKITNEMSSMIKDIISFCLIDDKFDEIYNQIIQKVIDSEQEKYDYQIDKIEEMILEPTPKEFKRALKSPEIRKIEEWTNKTFDKIIFDSNEDQWDIGNSVLEEKLGSKNNLLFVVSDVNGNKFGYYLSSKGGITKDNYCSTDENSFLFSLKSNGRLNGMMKFEIKNTDGGYRLFSQSDDILIQLGYGYNGAIHLMKSSKKSHSYCYQHDDYFNYHGTSNPLIGKSNGSTFIPQRIVVIQMK